MSQLQTDDAVHAKLAQDSPIAIVISVLADGQILDVNDSFLHLFGYTRDEVIGQTSAGLGIWADPTQRAELTAALVAGSPLRDFETTVRTKTGAERQVLATVSQVEIDGSTCLLTQLYDITAYRRTETRFRALVEQLPVTTYAHGLDGLQTLVYISPQVETMLGYSPVEILAGRPDFLTSRTHPEDQETLREAVEYAMATGEPLCVEYRVRARDGRWVWLRDEAVLVRDEQERPLVWQGVIADITDWKQAEAARRESEERFRALVQNSYDVITIVTPDGTRRYISPSIERVLGYRPSDLLGQSAVELVHPDDASRLQDAIQSCLRGAKETSILELRFRHRDGSWRDFEAIGTNLLQEPSVAGIVFNSRDITARKAAQRALQASEARLAEAQETAFLGSWEWDIAGESVVWSNQLFRIFGIPPGPLGGSKEEFIALIHPADREMVSAAIEHAVVNAEPFTFDHRTILPDGEVRILHVRGEVTVGDDGHPLRIHGTSQDITERVQTEEALRQSEERFRSAFEHAPIGMALMTEDGRFLQVNQSLCAMLAASGVELLGKSFAEITLAEDRSVDGDLVQQLLRGEIASYQVEKRLVRKTDEVIWVRLTVSLMRGSPGESLCFVAQVQDITPFKAAGAALRESEDRFRSAFDHAPIGMSLVAQDGRYMQVNRALCELVGYSEEELLGRTFQAITHPDDLADDLDLFERLWAGEIDTYQLEKRYLHKDGHVVWIHLTGSIVRDANGPKYGIAQILDITDRRRVDMDRAIMLASEREYTRQLRALTEMRADLTAMIAHELRAPVAALRMITFLLATGELSSQDESEMFAAVKGEIEQLDRLINDVADVTAAEREDFSVQLNSVPLNVMFENAATFARAKLGSHPFTVPPVPNVNVWCDAERISQVLRNLLDNAATHTPPGTPVELRAHRDGARVRIEVADRGPGLSAADVALIFEKFGRGRQAMERQTLGAGLGLYLSRQIMMAHGSDLTVESAPGKGTVFAFELKVDS
jgi:PAS domain S-box-containing protein